MHGGGGESIPHKLREPPVADKMNTDYWNRFYSGITPPLPSYQPGMTGRGLPLSAVDRLPKGSAGIDPIGWTPPPVASWNQPTRMDLAAIDQWDTGMSPGASPETALAMFPPVQPTPAVAAATDLANPVTNVTASMKPQGGGGLLDLIFGPSKNGLGGLPGLMGGPQQGGILQMLFGGGKSTSGLPRRAIPASAATDPRGFAIGEANRRNPNPTYNVSGDKNAFSPTSVQNSSRWQTGY